MGDIDNRINLSSGAWSGETTEGEEADKGNIMLRGEFSGKEKRIYAHRVQGKANAKD